MIWLSSLWNHFWAGSTEINRQGSPNALLLLPLTTQAIFSNAPILVYNVESVPQLAEDAESVLEQLPWNTCWKLSACLFYTPNGSLQFPSPSAVAKLLLFYWNLTPPLPPGARKTASRWCLDLFHGINRQELHGCAVAGTSWRLPWRVTFEAATRRVHQHEPRTFHSS